MTDILLMITGILTLLVLPAAAFIAGRWTGDRWIIAFGVAVALLRIPLSLSERWVDKAFFRYAGGGIYDLAYYIIISRTVIGLIDVLLISALVLLVARAARRRDTGEA